MKIGEIKKLKGYNANMKVFLKENKELTLLLLTDIGWSSNLMILSRKEEGDLEKVIFYLYEDVEELDIVISEGTIMTGFYTYSTIGYIENDYLVLEKVDLID